MHRLRHRKVLSLVALAAVIAAAIAVVVGSATATQAHVTLPKAFTKRVAANRTRLARKFPLLTAARTASSTAVPLPEKFVKEIAEQARKPLPAGALGEPDPTMAVYVGSVTTAVHGTLKVWAMPGPNDLCIAKVPETEKGASVECQSNAVAAAGGLVGADEGNGSFTTIGFFPGGAARVTVHHATGPDVVVPATNGLWVINNEPQAVSVSASTISGTVPLPSTPGASQ